VANYRISINRNTNSKEINRGQSEQNVDHLRLFLLLKPHFLKIYVNIPTALAAETHRAMAGETMNRTEHGKVMNFPSRDMKADCFEDMGETFIVTKDIY
jgi:hypothetical protein